MNNVKNGIKKVYLSQLAMSIVVGLLGLFLVFSPEFILSAISLVVGAVVIIPGIMCLVEFFKTKSNFRLIVGVVSCIVGCIFMFNSKFVSSILPFILGVYFVIMGLTKLQYGLELRKNKISQYLKTLLAGVIALVCGGFIVFNPFETATTMTMIIGIMMACYCVFDIYNIVIIGKEIDRALVIMNNRKNYREYDEDDRVREAEYEEKTK